MTIAIDTQAVLGEFNNTVNATRAQADYEELTRRGATHEEAIAIVKKIHASATLDTVEREKLINSVPDKRAPAVAVEETVAKEEEAE
ncbi:MAG: hypothetical protein K2X93_17285 [Candidatus Obscuribacterales bacterium]|nr:hypothetical protein [Candidatus Obscuribacterales bacterium]